MIANQAALIRALEAQVDAGREAPAGPGTPSIGGGAGEERGRG